MKLMIEQTNVKTMTKFNKSIEDKIITFLNANGGVIYIGLKSNATIVGVKNVAETLKKISDIANNKISPQITNENLLINVLDYEGLKVIKIILKNMNNKKYTSKSFAVKTEINNAIYYANRNKTLNSSTYYNPNSLSVVKSRYNPLTFKTLKILLNEVGVNVFDKDFLENFGLLNWDKKSNRLAELLADKNFVSMIFAIFNGIDKVNLFSRQDFGNQSILNAIKIILSKVEVLNYCWIKDKDNNIKHFSLIDCKCFEIALFNAIINNDWNYNTPAIYWFANRVEIVSYGNLLFGQTAKDFMQGKIIPRNVELLDIFNKIYKDKMPKEGIDFLIKKYGSDIFEITDSYMQVTIPFKIQLLNN